MSAPDVGRVDVRGKGVGGLETRGFVHDRCTTSRTYQSFSFQMKVSINIVFVCLCMCVCVWFAWFVCTFVVSLCVCVVWRGLAWFGVVWRGLCVLCLCLDVRICCGAADGHVSLELRSPSHVYFAVTQRLSPSEEGTLLCHRRIATTAVRV